MRASAAQLKFPFHLPRAGLGTSVLPGQHVSQQYYGSISIGHLYRYKYFCLMRQKCLTLDEKPSAALRRVAKFDAAWSADNYNNDMDDRGGRCGQRELWRRAWAWPAF